MWKVTVRVSVAEVNDELVGNPLIPDSFHCQVVLAPETMSNPLSAFRRHQRTLIAVFGVFIVLVFVVGSSVDKMFSGPPKGVNNVVVSWKNRSITDKQFRLLQRRHGMAMDFVQRVANATRKRAGEPKDVVLTPAADKRELALRIILAEEASKLGVVVGDEAVLDYLDRLSDEGLTDQEFREFLRESGREATEDMLFEQLKQELLARRMQEMAGTGLRTSTPAESWQYYVRLNQQAVTEVYRFKAEDFLYQVKQKPTKAELTRLYEDGKEQFPNPESPDPGFRIRDKIAFQYVKVEFEKLLEEELKSVTDEQIQKEYEKQVADGQHKTTDPLPSEKEEKDEDGEKKDGEKKDEKPDESKGGDKPAETKPAETKPAETKPAETKPAETKPAETKPAETPPAKKPAEPAKDEGECQDPPKADNETKPEDDKPAAEKKENAPTEKAASDKTEKPEADQATSDKAATDKAATDKAAADKTAADKAAADKAAADKTATDKAAADKAAADKTGTDKATGDEPKVDPTAPVERIRSLEEVKDSIARSLARPGAQAKLDAGVSRVEQAIRKYGNALSRHQAAVVDAFSENRDLLPKDVQAQFKVGGSRAINQYVADNPELDLTKLKIDSTRPAELDLEGIVEEINGDVKIKDKGFSHEVTHLSDIVEIADTDIGKAMTFSFANNNFQQITFAQTAYGDGVPLYSTAKIGGQLSDTTFIYWRTKIKDARTPAFKEVRDDVVTAWKLNQAYGLAEEAAKAMQETANEAKDKPLAESLTEDQAKQVVRPMPFSWLTVGSARGMFGQNNQGMPRLGTVQLPTTNEDGDETTETVVAGQTFMESVFAIEPGSTGIAPNQPKTEVFVVRVESHFPNNESLRSRFMTTGPTNTELVLSSMDRQRVIAEWLQDLEEELNVRWRDPN